MHVNQIPSISRIYINYTYPQNLSAYIYIYMVVIPTTQALMACIYAAPVEYI